MKLMIVGATGVVGQRVLEYALQAPQVTELVAPVRRPESVPAALRTSPKLMLPQVDFEQLPEHADWWQVDAVICALGTTRRAAGSQAAFHRVDHDYPLMVARAARLRGAATFVLNSAVGADPASRFFYNRTKGEVERDLRDVGFTSLTLARPGLIGGERAEFRFGERLLGVVLQGLGPLLPKGWRINPADHIARAMLDAALAATPGERVISSAELA